MRLFLQFQVVMWLLAATVWGKDFKGGTIVEWGAQDLSFGDVHVFPNTIWSMINNAASNFRGNIQVDKTGGLYVSTNSSDMQLSATAREFALHPVYSFINDGIVSFNAIKGAPLYAFWIIGKTFKNTGDLFFSASGEGTAISGVKSEDWHNNGNIHFYQTKKSGSFVQLGKDAKTLQNDGQVCFTNQNWHQLAGVLGTGCFTALGKSSFYLMNNAVPFSENQILYLDGSESSIMAIPTNFGPLTYHVRGFGTYEDGNANKIGLTATLRQSDAGEPAWEYDVKNGNLTLRVGPYVSSFEIGTGYDPKKFEVVSDTSEEIPQVHLGAVQYNGPPPQTGIPTECKPCKPIPDIPEVAKPAPSSSSTVETTLRTSLSSSSAATETTLETTTSAVETTMSTSSTPVSPTGTPSPSETTSVSSSSKSRRIKTVTVMETDIVMFTSTVTITSTVTL